MLAAFRCSNRVCGCSSDTEPALLVSKLDESIEGYECIDMTDIDQQRGPNRSRIRLADSFRSRRFGVVIECTAALVIQSLPYS